jgi:transcriptional regulator with XRE-family HTH domain
MTISRATSSTSSGAGTLLRHWRTARHLSQLELALEAGVSARHLSYVETGRSQPSREMLLRLADALEVPLRERNGLLIAAGYAPCYYETGLAAPEMAQMLKAIDLILNHQEPYPAIVMDRYWEVKMGNRAAAKFTTFLLGREPRPAETNIMRLCLHPEGARPVTENWEEVAEDLVRHLRAQVAGLPSDERARALLDEVLSYPGVSRDWGTNTAGAPATPLLTTTFRRGDVALRYFSTFTTFGAPHDVTLQELRIECTFPADEETAERSRELFGS